ncbi:ABC transporter ATP-binding protein [Marinobacter xestospongiae]|uniref:ABC transporter ATP-binding protein n=1 Tax=Marinobacter xestospongiae TaxID=994319 RepID=UPI002003F7EE|nr:ATP-binding cassette domain-containing protein [Marinobacter xestospongiae]MCK7568963.1 ATP-binding cassette domain-containing protein [Marinobacter xestospongiae]
MIRVERLCLRVFDNLVLRDISFQVDRGETLALVGESGGGKTSLARLMAGLLHGQPCRQPRGCVRARGRFRWSGTVWFDGFEILRARPRQVQAFRVRELGWLPQALSDALNPNLTVIQHVQELLEAGGRTCADAHGLCVAHHIPVDLHHRYPSGLSGGEIQRLLAALAMANNPRYLILDEPTASLDHGNRERVIESFGKGREERCQLLITHDLDLARRIADRIGVLRNGRLVEVGPVATVFGCPEHDYTRKLLSIRHEATYSGPWCGGRAQAAIPEPGKGRACRQLVRDGVSPGPDSSKEPCRLVEGLEILGLSHEYAGQPVLEDISLFVPIGTCLVVTGESGSGKSTLARLLAGFEPVRRGKVTWRSPLHPEGAGRSSLRPVLISQHSHRALAPHFSVCDVLAEAFQLENNKRGSLRAKSAGVGIERMISLLDRVGLPTAKAFLQRKTAALSGGEAQRLVIARALVGNPCCLVADEPTSALDMASCQQVLMLLDELKRFGKVAIVVFTHDQRVVRHLADQAVLLGGGRLQPLSVGQRMADAPVSL